MLHLLSNANPSVRDASMSAVEVTLDASGHVLLPDDVRQILGAHPGVALLLDVTDDGVLLWTRGMAARALVGLVSECAPTASALVCELAALRGADVPPASRQTNDTPARAQRARR